MKYIIVGAFFLFAAMAQAGTEDPCLGCHTEKTPGIVQYWKNSAHFVKKVYCADCHGRDIEANHKGRIIVDSAKCGSCHKKALSDHQLSKHSMGLRAGKACTRNMDKSPDRERTCVLCHKPGSAQPTVNTECAMFLAQTPEIQRQGCGSCHAVETRCDSCHTKHGTDLELARDPGICGTCHMGPDHPQLEMWETSQHGVIYKRSGVSAGPSCATCHMPKGSHNVSNGIASGLPKEAADIRARSREQMLSVCTACHTGEAAKRSLNDADAIERQSRELVEEARAIVEKLHQEGILLPPVSERPKHPLLADAFTTGPHMLYENNSSIEGTFFKMRTFYAAMAFKGAFHQNPDYTHWYGNAPLKLALSEIKSQAAQLRQISALKKRVDNLGNMAVGSDKKTGDDIRTQLQELKERMLRGEISSQDFESRKNKLLDEKGL
jgi:hypothetical protein